MSSISTESKIIDSLVDENILVFADSLCYGVISLIETWVSQTHKLTILCLIKVSFFCIRQNMIKFGGFERPTFDFNQTYDTIIFSCRRDDSVTI